MRHPFGWYYPPGVTDRDIDEHLGSPPECPECNGRGTNGNFVTEDGQTERCPFCCGTGIAPDKDDGGEE